MNSSSDAPVARGAFGEAASISYREGDESAMKSGSRLHYCALLGQLSSSFKRKIDVLDAGCGTGRYFQCLKSVRRLLGIDLSPHMVEQARNPAKGAGLDIETIELRRGDVASLDLPTGAFDFIYSTGVVGEYAPVDAQLLKTCAGLLKEDGVLFFTAVDACSRIHITGRRESIGLRVLRKLFPFLPAALRLRVNRKLSPHFVTREELTALLADSVFADFTITRYEHPPGGWAGAHYDCIAFKSVAARARLGNS